MNFINHATIEGHSGAIYALQFDGNFIYSASADKYVVRWDVNNFKQDKFAICLPSTPFSIAVFNNQTKLAVGLSNGDLHIFDILLRKEINFIKLHQKGVFCIKENKIKNHVYTTDGNGTLCVWESVTFKLLLQLPFGCGKIRKITLSSDGNWLYLCCQNGNIKILETNFFNEINEFYAHENGVACFLQLNNNLFLSGGKDAHLKLWDLSQNQYLKSIPAHNFMIYDLLQFDITTYVSASRDKTIKIWNQNLDVIQRLDFKSKGHRHSVNCLVKISENSFASASDDGKIIIWSR